MALITAVEVFFAEFLCSLLSETKDHFLISTDFSLNNLKIWVTHPSELEVHEIIFVDDSSTSLTRKVLMMSMVVYVYLSLIEFN